MAWSGSTRASRLPDDWAQRRKRVFRRDGHRCTARLESGGRCGEPAEECDHVVPGDNHDESNLTSLCRWHHSQKSAREGAAASAQARRRRTKKFDRTETHPALMV